MAELDPRWQPAGADNNRTVTAEYLAELQSCADELMELRRWIEENVRTRDCQLAAVVGAASAHEFEELCCHLDELYGRIA